MQNQKRKYFCPLCGEQIEIKRKQDITKAYKRNRICKKCIKKINNKKKEKICFCGNHFFGYKSQKYCEKCLEKIKTKKFKRGLNGIIPVLSKEEYKNDKNSMQGFSVYFIWMQKYGKEEADRRIKLQKEKLCLTYKMMPKEKLEEINRKKTRHLIERNPMKGRSVYSVWVQKYGKEEADKKMIKLKEKRSKNATGKNNPMYGKPAPKGSGNGISGWYKGWFFRSLRQLSYMIQVIEKEGHEWKSLDNTSDFRIKYIDKENHERSYCPDFLIDNKIVIEIKPQKLQETDNVLRKENAAIIFCKMRNLQYVKTDIDIIDFSRINEMVENKIIVLTEKSLIKFNKYKNKIQRRI